MEAKGRKGTQSTVKPWETHSKAKQREGKERTAKRSKGECYSETPKNKWKPMESNAERVKMETQQRDGNQRKRNARTGKQRKVKSKDKHCKACKKKSMRRLGMHKKAKGSPSASFGGCGLSVACWCISGGPSRRHMPMHCLRVFASQCELLSSDPDIMFMLSDGSESEWLEMHQKFLQATVPEQHNVAS